MEVVRKRTAASPEEIASALLVGLKNSALEVTQELAYMLHAQLMLETGRGKSLFNFNPGNISVFPSKHKGDFYRPIWFRLKDIEAVSDPVKRARYMRIHEKMNAGKAPMAFASSPTLAAGITYHLQFVKRRFPQVLGAASTGSGMAMGEAIYNSKYCRDDSCQPHIIGPAINSIADQMRTKGLFAALPVSSMPGEIFPGAAISSVPAPPNEHAASFASFSSFSFMSIVALALWAISRRGKKL